LSLSSLIAPEIVLGIFTSSASLKSENIWHPLHHNLICLALQSQLFLYYDPPSSDVFFGLTICPLHHNISCVPEGSNHLSQDFSAEPT